MEYYGWLMIHNSRPMHYYRWLMVDYRWTMKYYRRSVNYDVWSMINFRWWMINDWGTAYHYVILSGGFFVFYLLRM